MEKSGKELNSKLKEDIEIYIGQLLLNQVELLPKTDIINSKYARKTVYKLLSLFGISYKRFDYSQNNLIRKHNSPIDYLEDFSSVSEETEDYTELYGVKIPNFDTLESKLFALTILFSYNYKLVFTRVNFVPIMRVFLNREQEIELNLASIILENNLYKETVYILKEINEHVSYFDEGNVISLNDNNEVSIQLITTYLYLEDKENWETYIKRADYITNNFIGKPIDLTNKADFLKSIYLKRRYENIFIKKVKEAYDYSNKEDEKRLLEQFDSYNKVFSENNYIKELKNVLDKYALTSKIYYILNSIIKEEDNEDERIVCFYDTSLLKNSITNKKVLDYLVDADNIKVLNYLSKDIHNLLETVNPIEDIFKEEKNIYKLYIKEENDYQRYNNSTKEVNYKKYLKSEDLKNPKKYLVDTKEFSENKKKTWIRDKKKLGIEDTYPLGTFEYDLTDKYKTIAKLYEVTKNKKTDNDTIFIDSKNLKTLKTNSLLVDETKDSISFKYKTPTKELDFFYDKGLYNYLMTYYKATDTLLESYLESIIDKIIIEDIKDNLTEVKDSFIKDSNQTQELLNNIYYSNLKDIIQGFLVNRNKVSKKYEEIRGN